MNAFVDLLPTLILIGGIAYVAYLVLREHFGVGTFFGKATSEEPVISSTDLLTERGLQQVDKGRVAGYPYLLLTNGSGRVMLHITLPKVSTLHLVAIGTKSSSSRPLAQQIRNHFLEPVVLEGDFPKDFRLYCTPGHQTEIRQVFEPVTMTYVMEFCRPYQIEIFRNTFYIAQAENATDPRDSTTMIEDTKHLLERHGDLLIRLGTLA